MCITIDTDTHRIIVPNSFFDQIDKMNDLLTTRGAEKIDYVQFVKEEFAKAIDKPMLRQSDIAKSRK